MRDLISRRAAIEEIKAVFEWHDTVTMERMIEHFNNLPSAQPETHEERTETHACDCISRQQAIDAMEQAKEQYFDRRVIIEKMQNVVSNLPSAQPETHEERTETHACDLISRQAAITAIQKAYADTEGGADKCAVWKNVGLTNALHIMQDLPSAQPDIEKICTRIKAEAIKRNVEYMKHGDRYMLGFVDGMRLARRIVDGTIDDPVYFTLSGK